MAGCTVDVKGRRVSSCQHWEIYPVFAFEMGKCDICRTPITPGVSPITAGNLTEQHIQPIGNKECQSRQCGTDSYWSESFGKRIFSVGCLRTSKARERITVTFFSPASFIFSRLINRCHFQEN